MPHSRLLFLLVGILGLAALLLAAVLPWIGTVLLRVDAINRQSEI